MDRLYFFECGEWMNVRREVFRRNLQASENTLINFFLTIPLHNSSVIVPFTVVSGWISRPENISLEAAFDRL